MNNLTRDRLNLYLLAILETLAETPRNEAPEGLLYAALMTNGVDLGTFQALRGLLLTGKLCEVTLAPNVLRITDRGLEIVRRAGEARR